MTVFESFRKTLFAGIGAQEKFKEMIDEFVKKGELSKSQGSKLAKEWTDRADKSTSEIGKSVSELVEKTLEKMNIPTKTEIDKLGKKIQALSARVKKVEEKTGAASEE